jgi:hypothetical protein
LGGLAGRLFYLLRGKPFAHGLLDGRNGRGPVLV